jgi:uncharacterized protein
VSDSSQLFPAIKAGDIQSVEQMVARDPLLVDAREEGGGSAVLTALYYGQPAIADLLITRGAQLDVFAATAAGRTGRVVDLIEQDPSLVNAFAPDGFQPLGLAAFFGHLPLVELLLANGAEANSPSRNSMHVMPLHSAVAGRHLEITRALLSHGADVNARQADDFSPLHEAAQNGQIEMVELLLSYGADKEARKIDGQTALSIAVEQGYEQVATRLR